MKKEITKKNKEGFTLVETLIYVVIFSIFIVVAVSYESNMTATRLHNQTALEVNDQGAKVMKTITQAIRNANQVNSPTISNVTSSLSLATGTPSTSPTVFSESVGIIYVTEGSGSPVALTNNKVIISNLLFSNFSRVSTPGIIKVSFTLSSVATSTSPGGAYSFTFNGSGALRR